MSLNEKEYQKICAINKSGIIPHRHETEQEFLYKSRVLLMDSMWREDAKSFVLDPRMRDMRRDVLQQLDLRYGIILDWVYIHRLQTSMIEGIFGEGPAYCELSMIDNAFIEYLSVNINFDFFDKTIVRMLGYSPEYALFHELAHVGRIQLLGEEDDYAEVFSSLGARPWWHISLIAGYDAPLGKYCACIGAFIAIVGAILEPLYGIAAGAAAMLLVMVIGYLRMRDVSICQQRISAYMQEGIPALHLIYRLYADEICTICTYEDGVQRVFEKGGWRLEFLSKAYTNL